MQFFTRIGLLAALLALLQFAHAATVTVTSFSCSQIYFTMALTPAEITTARYLNILSAGQSVAELQFSGAYATVSSYQWYAVFNEPMTSGSQSLSFQLLDVNEEPIAAFPAVTQTLNFNCGVVVSTTAAATSTPTGTTGSNSGNNSNNSGSSSNDASSNSSGSGSSTGAIAGGVAGGAVALIIVALIAFCLMRRKKKQRNAQQSRLRNDEADEAAFRAPNNDSTTSLATAPETANTPMMRDVSTKNVFADPTTSTVSGAPSGASTLFTANNQPASKPSSGSSLGAAGAGAAAAGGIGAAAIAARKQSREQSRAQSPSQTSDNSPSSEFSKDSPMSQVPPPVPALPASAPAPYPTATQPASQPAAQSTSPASNPVTTPKDSSATGPVAAGAAAGTATVAAAAAAAAKAGSDNKTKGGKWGFKRASKDMGNSFSKPPYPQAVPEPIAVPAPASSTPSPTSNSPEMPASPSRSFKVIHKPSPAPVNAAGPSSASIAPSESSLNRAPVFAPRSGPTTPAGSIRGNNYSRAPSVASMSMSGFADAPPLPSGAASVASAPAGEFGGNMAGIGAGRSFAASSGNSTKWHQQSYNIMPNFSHRALARSTQLDEDLIFGHLGMGLSPPPGPAGNGSETGSSKSRTDPFGDR